MPTCNNITENSFLQDKDVQKAISCAPADVKTTYQQQAQQIEKIRIEWLDKARKEPPYDVFISYKDSDKENGIDRTQDSVDAMELYNLLKDKGYQVFYSRITLRDKVSEQYEPYIYNALKTAKVMIVFGEKPEYFSAVWLKNEWSRFINMITKGEKHKNSLVVVYKNMNPNDLPVVLKSRQCMNMSDLTFLTDLERHIKRVVDDSKKAAHLDRVEIQGGQISKKSSEIKHNRNKAEFYADLIQSFEVNMQLITAASGTASTEVLHYLGLSETDKSVIFSIIREDKVQVALSTLEEKFSTIKNGKGIAFAVPLSSVIGVNLYQFLSNNRRKKGE